MPSRAIKTLADVFDLAKLFSGLKMPITVSWVLGHDRSAEQNRLMWMWAEEVATQRGDVTKDDVQAEWKLHFGVPILRADDAAFCAEYDEIIRPLPYGMKLRLIRLMAWPVTSRMTVQQMTRFLDATHQDCADNGFRLTQPKDDLDRWMDTHREAA